MDQRGVDRGAGGLGHGNQRKPDFLAEQAKPGRCVFDALRVGFDKQRLMKRGQPILDSERGAEITSLTGSLEGRAQFWGDVGGDRNAPPCRHGR